MLSKLRFNIMYSPKAGWFCELRINDAGRLQQVFLVKLQHTEHGMKRAVQTACEKALESRVELKGLTISDLMNILDRDSEYFIKSSPYGDIRCKSSESPAFNLMFY